VHLLPTSDESTIHLQPPATPAALALAHLGGVAPLRPSRALELGTGAGVDLRLRDPYVSARHARITGEGARYVVDDLGSTNGTWIDGVRVQRAYLAPGMRLQLGCWRATVVVAPAPRPRPAARPPTPARPSQPRPARPRTA
jgi:predicted component of type VI protein secretion system